MHLHALRAQSQFSTINTNWPNRKCETTTDICEFSIGYIVRLLKVESNGIYFARQTWNLIWPAYRKTYININRYAFAYRDHDAQCMYDLLFTIVSMDLWCVILCILHHLHPFVCARGHLKCERVNNTLFEMFEWHLQILCPLMRKPDVVLWRFWNDVCLCVDPWLTRHFICERHTCIFGVQNQLFRLPRVD